jgi:uncharacterized protein (DUF305 family)
MQSPYVTLAKIVVINVVVMFFLTYVLIDTPEHFFLNINRFYMALLMAAPMVALMLFMMRHMFGDRQLNVVVYTLAAVAFIGALSLARTQEAVGDRQFLRSMIPHHSSAILMCERASISDAEIIRLCEQIVRSQKDEIAQMKGLLARVDE